MNGQETEQTREVKKFIEELKLKIKNFQPEADPPLAGKLKTNIEIVTEDERLSTVQANKVNKDDAVAAMYILQSYIDRNYNY